VPADVPPQEDAGLVPVALCRALGDTLQLGDLCEGEAAEELEVDELRQARVYGTECFECLGDALDLALCGGGGGGDFGGE